MEKAQRKRNRITRYINGIENAEVRLIFKMKYKDGLSWEAIGERIFMSESGVRKKYDRYMEKLLASA